MMLHEKLLSAKQVRWFFIGAALFYIYPLVHADYAYIDDNWRALAMAEDAWRTQGRILLEVLSWVLTFSGGMINLFPMPLILSTCVLALAMTRLTLCYFPQPSIISCLIFLPMLCNPFFLGNLSYQYDAPGMVLAVAAAIYAVTCPLSNPLLGSALSSVLIAVVLSLYQPTIGVFVALCFVECFWAVRNERPVNQVLATLARRGLQLVAGGAIYFLSAYQLISNTRGDLSPINGQWLHIVWDKFMFSMEQIYVLTATGGGLVYPIFLVLALIGFCRLLKNIAVMPGGVLGRGLVAGCYLATWPVLIVCVPGVLLVIAEPRLDARNFIAFSVVLVLVLLLSAHVLGRVWHGLRWVVLVPVLFMFSLCYAYGQVLISKKELESAFAHYVAYDIVSNATLASLHTLYFLPSDNQANWLPRGITAKTHMPVLSYILGDANTVLYPHFLTRLGITNMRDGDRTVFDQAVAEGRAKPLLERKFYTVFLLGDDGFIVMHESFGPELSIELNDPDPGQGQ